MGTISPYGSHAISLPRTSKLMLRWSEHPQPSFDARVYGRDVRITSRVSDRLELWKKPGLNRDNATGGPRCVHRKCHHRVNGTHLTFTRQDGVRTT